MTEKEIIMKQIEILQARQETEGLNVDELIRLSTVERCTNFGGSFKDAETYLQYRNIEEAAVQFMTQEISKLENIVIIESEYDDMVGSLRDFNKTLGLFDNDFDFAKTLVETPVTDRINWLSSKVNDSMTKGLSFDDIAKMNDIIDLLS